ncbi:MAG: ribonuclease Y [Candidatus Saelkia tenebricola]|nr:ribonuclease Y [Candidatus Saelkia tenebricola]
MKIVFQLIGYVALLVVAGVIGYIVRTTIAKKNVKTAEYQAKDIIKKAEDEANARKKKSDVEAKELLFKLRADFDKENKERRQELAELERRLLQREENIERKFELLDQKEKDIVQKFEEINKKEEYLKKKEQEFNDLIMEEKFRLQQISGMSPEEAKEQLLKRMETEIRNEANVLLRKIDEETRAKAEEQAREIISQSVQKCAIEHTTETTVSVVPLSNDEMKGRIIGREGRNIRSYEMATGVDVIIDDTPEAVSLSCFDPYRREIARVAMARLVEDGRIHPARIEEVVEKVKKEMEKKIKEEGEHVALDLGVHNLHPEIIRLIGKLKYRTSYGQNVLQHSKEVAYLMGGISNELGLNFQLARRVGLLHDIGKAIDQDREGTHTQIGADLAKKYGENETIVNSIAAHHEDVEQKSVYAVLVQAADAVSGARPGARRETLEIYIKRLQNLENIANSFQGVDKSYAIQAGREIRIMVYPDKVNDNNSYVLAREIKGKIEDELEYPGQIKVMVIRETRAVEYAK